MAGVQSLAVFLDVDELNTVPETIRRKIDDHLQEQQAQAGTLEPIENVRRRLVQVENLNRTLRGEVKKHEDYTKELEAQLHDAGESKIRLQNETNLLKEQQNSQVTGSQTLLQQELIALRAEKTDLSSHVIRCDRDAQRYIATISELQNEKNELLLEKAERQAHHERQSTDFNDARHTIQQLENISARLRTQSEKESARANELVLSLQATMQRHADEVSTLKREAETFKQQAEVANRNEIQLAEQLGVLREKHSAMLQRQEVVRKQLAEKTDSLRTTLDKQTEQLRVAEVSSADQQRQIESLEAMLSQMERAVTANDNHQQQQHARFVELEKHFNHEMEMLKARVVDAEKRAELTVIAAAERDESGRMPTSLQAMVADAMDVNNNNLSHQYEVKCYELRLVRGENNLLREQVKELSKLDEIKGDPDPGTAADFRDQLDRQTRFYRTVTGYVATRCEELYERNVGLHRKRIELQRVARDYEQRLERAEFKCSALSQQVRYLILCCEKLQGADVSINADDEHDESDLTEQQIDRLEILRSKYDSGVHVGLKHESIDEIRRHYVNFAGVRELQLNNMKLIEAIYQLEANDVLRGGNVGDLHRELENANSNFDLAHAEKTEANKQVDSYINQRDIYRELCGPQLQTLAHPLIESDETAAKVRDILTSPKIFDIFEKLNRMKQTNDEATLEREALQQLLQFRSDHIADLQRQLSDAGEQWQKQMEEIRNECRAEHLSTLRLSSENVALETERAVRSAELQTHKDRVTQLEAMLNEVRQQVLAGLDDARALRADIQSRELKISQLEHENELLKSQVDFALRQEADANALYAAAKSRIQTLLPLQTQLDELRAEKTTLQANMQSSWTVIEGLNKNLADLQNRANQLEVANELLKAQLVTDVNAQKLLVNAGATELHAVQQQLENVRTELATLRTQYDALLAQNEINVDFHQEYESLRSANEQHEQMDRIHQQQLAELSSKLSSTSAELTAERAEQARLVEDYTRRLNEANMGSQSSNTMLKRLQAEKNQIARTIVQKDATIEQLRTSIAQLERQREDLDAQLQQTHTALAEQTAARQALEGQVTQLTSAANERDTRLQNLQLELDSVKQDRAVLVAELSQANSNLRTSQAKWIEMEASLIVQRDKLRRELDEAMRKAGSSARKRALADDDGGDQVDANPHKFAVPFAVPPLHGAAENVANKHAKMSSSSTSTEKPTTVSSQPSAAASGIDLSGLDHVVLGKFYSQSSSQQSNNRSRVNSSSSQSRATIEIPASLAMTYRQLPAGVTVSQPQQSNNSSLFARNDQSKSSFQIRRPLAAATQEAVAPSSRNALPVVNTAGGAANNDLENMDDNQDEDQEEEEDDDDEQSGEEEASDADSIVEVLDEDAQQQQQRSATTQQSSQMQLSASQQQQGDQDDADDDDDEEGSGEDEDDDGDENEQSDDGDDDDDDDDEPEELDDAQLGRRGSGSGDSEYEE